MNMSAVFTWAKCLHFGSSVFGLWPLWLGSGPSEGPCFWVWTTWNLAINNHLSVPTKYLPSFHSICLGCKWMRSKVPPVSCTKADKRNWAYPEIRFCLLSRLTLVYSSVKRDKQNLISGYAMSISGRVAQTGTPTTKEKELTVADWVLSVAFLP